MKLTDKFERCPGIYIFTNLVNGKIYVGETVNIKNRMKDHRIRKSGQVISCAIKKYGVENFKVEIYYRPSLGKEARLDLEEELILKFDCLVPKGYNVCKRGRSGEGKPCSEEQKIKISNANKGKVRSVEQRQNISKGKMGAKASEETKRKLSESSKKNNKDRIGKPLSSEIKIKISKAISGRKLSENHKKKISERMVGAI